ncbi:cytochrome bd-I oxidase subunit CydX [Rhizobium sp. CRIBSB]|nr:cytochrome bd-I oxidase subunit CydX [Rhizobium sp. CRIBSB]
MWYFTWILGLGLAVGFGVLNGLWHEFHLNDAGDAGLSADTEAGLDEGSY